MREFLESGLPMDFYIDAGSKIAKSGAGSNRLALRNASSYALCIDELHVASPVAGTFTLKAHNTTSTLGTSAAVITPRSAIVGTSAAVPTGWKSYYGTNAATSGVSMSGAYTLYSRRLEASGTINFCDTGPLIICSNRGFGLLAIPSSQQSIQVSCRARVLPWQTIRTIG
mgnify:CR=1 FL=1